MRVIRVGFFLGNRLDNWMGGFNYFKNLLYATKLVNNTKYEFFVFVGTKNKHNLKQVFGEYAVVKQSVLFNDNNIFRLIIRVFEKIFNKAILHNIFIKLHTINLVSHRFNFDKIIKPSITWIPDFQHLHLPNMFSLEEVKSRNSNFKKAIEISDLVILSSFDAEKDFKAFSPNNSYKARVLQFVSQPEVEMIDKLNMPIIKKRYDIDYSYFFMPNQFWKHKNHLVVIDALIALKKEGIEARVICTGDTKDFRNKDFFLKLNNTIENNDLKENFIILGNIKYEDVIGLLIGSICLINPSFFEGWSSTVEECKSLNKKMILSNLSVHIEQVQNNLAVFFDPNDSKALAALMKKEIEKKEITDSFVDKELLNKRTLLYGNSYLGYLDEINK